MTAFFFQVICKFQSNINVLFGISLILEASQTKITMTTVFAAAVVVVVVVVVDDVVVIVIVVSG